MSEAAAAETTTARSSGAVWKLAALIAGLAIGALLPDQQTPLQGALLGAAGFLGTLWLNALKMTVVPLVVALLVSGIARSAEAAQGGRVAARSVVWIVIVCTISAVFGALLMLLLTHLLPLTRGTAAALQAALAGVEKPSSSAIPGALEFFKGVIPPNVIAAASNGDVLPLVVFSVFFALALTRINAAGRERVVALFEAVAEALLVIITSVLWIAPLGIAALAITVGHEAGGTAFAGLGHYILLISAVGLAWIVCAAYPMGIVVGRQPAGAFARALIGPQAVAVSTRSSLACLPAMLNSARTLGIREQVADVSLPLAVALFRSTGPAMNVAVAFYVAHWLGLHPTPTQMIAATAVGAVMSYGAVSLPGEITFISSIAPISLALGLPIAPLALLVAVEMIPDIFRTLGNVTFDVALAAVADRTSEGAQTT